MLSKFLDMICQQKDDEALNDHRADCVDWVDILKASSKIE